MVDIVLQVFDQLSIGIVRDDRLSGTVESTDKAWKTCSGAKLENRPVFYELFCILLQVFRYSAPCIP